MDRSMEVAPVSLDIISHSVAQTQRLGARLGELLSGGELILLDGELGTGKTVFTQGIAQGLGIPDIVNSPTFTILKEYRGGRLPLYHFDLYRIDDPNEVLTLGFEDYFYGQGVCVVEWAHKAEGIWPAEHLRIRLKVISDTKRGLVFQAYGTIYTQMLKMLQRTAYAH
jgi:tRNA threonylcarbamoyladenosine biosynthesis protein TsaE